jgi:hypothetical protein
MNGYIKYAVEIGSGGMIYIPSLIKFGTGVQAILRVWFSNMKGCDVGIDNGRDLWRISLKWTRVARYKYQVL